MKTTSQKNSARAVAVQVMQAVLTRRRMLEEALEEESGFAALETRDRGFVHLMVATALSHLGSADAILKQCLNKPLDAAQQPVMQALRLGVAQLLWLKTPAHAAVDATVEAVAECGFTGLKGLANAVLKRISREGAGMLASMNIEKTDSPEWLWKRWCAYYGEENARAMAKMHAQKAPLDVSVKSDAEGWAKKLGGVVLPTGSVRLTGDQDVRQLAGFDEGEWWVQDAAASLPVRLLGNVKGKTVLDLCAAPGGKTAQLASLGAKVVAVDQSPLRMRRLEENMQRLRLPVETVTADVAVWKPQAAFDMVLLDAPCSATGTIRRHPELAWIKTEKDVKELAGMQRKILAQVLSWLPLNVPLVYVVCSLEKEESAGNIDYVLQNNSDIKLLNVQPEFGGEWITKRGELRTLPCNMSEQGGMDGFYAAMLAKEA